MGLAEDLGLTDITKHTLKKVDFNLPNSDILDPMEVSSNLGEPIVSSVLEKEVVVSSSQLAVSRPAIDPLSVSQPPPPLSPPLATLELFGTKTNIDQTELISHHSTNSPADQLQRQLVSSTYSMAAQPQPVITIKIASIRSGCGLSTFCELFRQYLEQSNYWVGLMLIDCYGRSESKNFLSDSKSHSNDDLDPALDINSKMDIGLQRKPAPLVLSNSADVNPGGSESRLIQDFDPNNLDYMIQECELRDFGIEDHNCRWVLLVENTNDSITKALSFSETFPEDFLAILVRPNLRYHGRYKTVREVQSWFNQMAQNSTAANARVQLVGEYKYDKRLFREVELGMPVSFRGQKSLVRIFEELL
ncbi:MAG: hypothetical protein LBC43_03230 [Bifidobacteriaceae bacterium]|jgi:hypothetical protein|nr:hypothetical protein [Bifidobacteriaceae bacterium]